MKEEIWLCENLSICIKCVCVRVFTHVCESVSVFVSVRERAGESLGEGKTDKMCASEFKMN